MSKRQVINRTMNASQHETASAPGCRMECTLAVPLERLVPLERPEVPSIPHPWQLSIRRCTVNATSFPQPAWTSEVVALVATGWWNRAASRISRLSSGAAIGRRSDGLSPILRWA